ncbi:hypothetical protein [Marihabitans asiaticum]|uniref:Uncharacterized protein n=1 Tax=Marihabitans asiaticum TaxID=415218 RepID=A0A560WAK3_9MICO|nr:hypothetical protein [Marihabitans asiaticum]TWD14656.1 hypothetical protein FB557_2078 [Marihabitans asiaticum]
MLVPRFAAVVDVDDVFFAGVFLAEVFLAGVFLADVLAGALFAVVFFVEAFFVGVFFAGVFFVEAFFVEAFFAGVLVAGVLVAGVLVARSCSSGSVRARSAADAPARSPVSSSGQADPRGGVTADDAFDWAEATSRVSATRTTSRARVSTSSVTER